MAGLSAPFILALGYAGLESGKARILADPVTAINNFLTATQPVYAEFDRIEKEASRINLHVDSSRTKRTIEALVRLKSENDALSDRIRAMPAANAGVRAIRDELLSAQRYQRKHLDAFTKYVETGDHDKYVRGPNGLKQSHEAYVQHLSRANSLVEAYLKVHGLQKLDDNESAKP